MYLRLAFSVAAHLEPEILIVDEVLAVGDAAFQQKCLGRMGEVASEGRTVLFVSHNLTAVSRLCPRAMLLSHGRKITEGPTAQVIDRYLSTGGEAGGVSLAERTDREGSGRLRFDRVGFTDGTRPVDNPVTGEDLEVLLGYHTVDGAEIAYPRVNIAIYTLLGELMVHLESDVSPTPIPRLPGHGQVRCAIPRLPLPPGRYVLNVFSAAGPEVLDFVRHAAEMTVAEGDYFGTGQRPTEGHQAVLVDHGWSVAEAAVGAEQ
jgi:lipopolysaccharide transport system ATP-binding protein